MNNEKVPILICGSRHFTDYPLLAQVTDTVLRNHNLSYESVEIVSGAAQGADSLGERYALIHNIPCVRFPADWERFGRSAGPRRNSQMIEYLQQSTATPIVIAFVTVNSVGTRDTINKAHRAGIKVVEINVSSDPAPFFNLKQQEIPHL